MTLSFLLLIVAALIFRLLAIEAGRAFRARLRALIPRHVPNPELFVLLKDFPDRIPAFRATALPLQARQGALNTLSCATLLLGLWVIPPASLTGFDLQLVRYAGLAAVLGAFAVDAVAFARMSYAARALAPEADTEPEG